VTRANCPLVRPYLVLLLLLVAADPKPTAYDIQEALSRNRLQTSGTGTRNTFRAAFIPVECGLHRTGGVEARPRGAEPLPDHPPRSSYDSCKTPKLSSPKTPTAGVFVTSKERYHIELMFMDPCIIIQIVQK